jgi:hypothetical protein
MSEVREELFEFCDVLVSEGVHFITFRAVPSYANSLLCPANSVLLICASPLGEKVVVRFTCDTELEVGR